MLPSGENFGRQQVHGFTSGRGTVAASRLGPGPRSVQILVDVGGPGGQGSLSGCRPSLEAS